VNKKTVCITVLFIGLFCVFRLGLAESEVLATFKQYLAEMKSAKNVDEISDIEKRNRPKGFVQGTMILLQDIEDWRKSQLDPNELEIKQEKETGDTALIEYALKNNPYSFGRANLIKEDGAWKIKDFGILKLPLKRQAEKSSTDKNVQISEQYKKEYYEDGKLMAEYPLRNGKVDGMAVLYYTNGNIKCYEPYRNGLRDGIRKCYYPDCSSCLQEEVSLKEGKLDGYYTIYTIEGAVYSKRKYNNGMLVEVEK